MKEQLHKRLPAAFVDEVLNSFNERKIGYEEACKVLDVKKSQFFSLRKKWLSAKIKRKKFRIWNRAKSDFHKLETSASDYLHKELKYICNEAKVFRNNFNFALLAEKAESNFNQSFNRNTIRLFALKHGYYHKTPPEKKKIYIRFETSHPGSLFQHDSSIHRWLPYTNTKQVLILTKDDYSRMIVGASLVEHESAFAHLETIKNTIIKYGIPLSYYVDNHSIFRFVKHESIHVRYTQKEADGKQQFKRALSYLGIGIIYAGIRKPQGKGKIEKAFDYFQRRLPFLVERYKIKNIADAKKTLDELIYFYNEKRVHQEINIIPMDRWKQAIKDNKSKIKPLDPNINLNYIFSIHLIRVVKKDGTISFMGKNWKINFNPNSHVTVCLIPGIKFMVYHNNTKLAEFFL